MATALIVTFTATHINRETGYTEVVGVTSQTLTFVDVKPAERALEAIKETHARIGDLAVEGTILKDVVI